MSLKAHFHRHLTHSGEWFGSIESTTRIEQMKNKPLSFELLGFSVSSLMTKKDDEIFNVI